MKHKQYETWILMNEELSLDQQRELHHHLKNCSQCQEVYRTAQQITHLFKTNPAPEPAPGFADRWQQRITHIENQKRNRILWTTISIVTVSAVVFLATIGFQLNTLLADFPEMLLSLLVRLVNWSIFFTHLWDVLDPFFSIGIKFISPTWILTFGFGLSGVLTAWVLTWYRSRTVQKELAQ